MYCCLSVLWDQLRTLFRRRVNIRRGDVDEFYGRMVCTTRGPVLGIMAMGIRGQVSVLKGIGRTGVVVIIVVDLCLEDGGGDEGDGDEFLVCAWGVHEEGIVAGSAVSGGGVGCGTGFWRAGAWGRRGCGGGGVGRRARGMAEAHLKDVVVVVLFGGGGGGGGYVVGWRGVVGREIGWGVGAVAVVVVVVVVKEQLVGLVDDAVFRVLVIAKRGMSKSALG